MICKDRLGNVVKEDNSQDNMLKAIYGSVLGRAFLHVATRPVISKVAGFFLSTGLSRVIIKPFISSNNIDMSEYTQRSYKSYNDFFTREIKPDKRPVDNASNVLVSPSDGRVSAYKINSDSVFEIKGSYYTVESILQSRAAAKHYMDGYCVIIRLCVDNYHRYSYVDNGTLGNVKFIKGVLHTVNPEALKHYNIYKENCRECSVLNTENFGKITCVEVGALMVGKIKNLHSKGYKFTKGEEKGMFEFGGSTVVLFIEKDMVILDEDLLKNTEEGFETAVNMGERIGQHI